MRKTLLAAAGPIAVAAALCAAPVARAQDAVEIGAGYVVDTVLVAPGDGDSHVYLLDNLDVTLDLDLAGLVGWRGATAHFDVLNNFGDIPNDGAGTLQGIDNIEVPTQRLRLFEAWIEQKLGDRSSVRAGLYDLNSEFYANDAAGLLLAPAFGVGSEIAATGPNGPSIFPSTALAVRVDRRFGDAGFVRAAVLNAAAGTLGDPGGVDLHFNHGALGIVEGGVEGDGGKFAVGLWGYTDRQDDIYATDSVGDPLKRRARGAYLVAERPVTDPEGAHATWLFVRAGISDGDTSPFRGGWQAGVLVQNLFAGRPDSAISIGANQGYLSAGYRAILRDGGIDAAPAETAFELTYSDKLLPWLTIQPDLQLVLAPGGDRDADAVFVGALRLSIDL